MNPLFLGLSARTSPRNHSRDSPPSRRSHLQNSRSLCTMLLLGQNETAQMSRICHSTAHISLFGFISGITATTRTTGPRPGWKESWWSCDCRAFLAHSSLSHSTSPVAQRRGRRRGRTALCWLSSQQQHGRINNSQKRNFLDIENKKGKSKVIRDNLSRNMFGDLKIVKYHKRKPLKDGNF